MAIILADLKLDKETIVAGILHDVVEDTVMTVEQVGEQFGTDVAFFGGRRDQAAASASCGQFRQ